MNKPIDLVFNIYARTIYMIYGSLFKDPTLKFQFLSRYLLEYQVLYSDMYFNPKKLGKFVF